MPSIGHGISDAVRNHIPVWIDDSTADILYDAYKKSQGILSKAFFKQRIRESDNWKRKLRRTVDSGYERVYYCKIVSKASLIVHSPPSDMSANGYVFCIDDSPVAGGKTKLQSTHVTTKISHDKTSAKPQDVQFVRFTQEELAQMKAEIRFGDGFVHLECKRTE